MQKSCLGSGGACSTTTLPVCDGKVRRYCVGGGWARDDCALRGKRCELVNGSGSCTYPGSGTCTDAGMMWIPTSDGPVQLDCSTLGIGAGYCALGGVGVGRCN